MSFFGFEQGDLNKEKQKFLEGGLHETEDVAVYTWGEESYDGLGDALQEGGDDLNDETFGAGPVGEYTESLSLIYCRSNIGLRAQGRTLTSVILPFPFLKIRQSRLSISNAPRHNSHHSIHRRIRRRSRVRPPLSHCLTFVELVYRS